ncbi:hypothetical protein GSI_08539 [Ganoderma sinense ZZ0214-1]|uniref:Uncharacterized protein n=1 Tax=Ganoderma sinense ZZ0214-1 TaxID=1077348 RepID=A0A2G8S412_9APHY|nr:hypothetical protein GSI_08539 [Ganoderma sinense ZZ0214-1]
MTNSSSELPSQEPGIRDSDGTLYGYIPPYKRPVSYASFASDLKKHSPSEGVIPGVAGDRRLTVDAEPNTRSPSEHSLGDSRSVTGQEPVESVLPPSEFLHAVAPAGRRRDAGRLTDLDEDTRDSFYGAVNTLGLYILFV